MLTKAPKVILLVETSHAYGRGLLRGIEQYSKTHGPWLFHREPPFYDKTFSLEERFSHLGLSHASGIIVREPKDVKQVLALNIPAIISPNPLGSRLPVILTDDAQIGELAAGHFLDRGFHSFAYCGYMDAPWSHQRYAGFEAAIQHAGYSVASYFRPVSHFFSPGERQQEELIEWLLALSRPSALMTSNDDLGRAVLEACRMAGIAVPEHLAVIGVDNDELTCEFTSPPLSSVDLDARKAGYDAAGLLDRLMRGEPMQGQIILHQPSRVVTRQSTDVIAARDPDVAQALVFIRRNCRKPIQVQDVVAAVALSRRHLYKKFMESIGHSVHDEIKHRRVEHICRLLLESNLTISQIADSMGFSGVAHISRYFRQFTEFTPGEYRRQFRKDCL